MKWNLLTLLVKHLENILVNFEQNRMIEVYTILSLDEKWLRADAILDNIFVSEKISDAKLLI